MDLDTLCIKFWANGCIVRYDILVTGEPGRAVSQQGPRTTQLSFNRELTSHQTEYWHLQLQCWQILDTPPLLSSSLCNCILFIWCRSQPSTDWYRVLLLLHTVTVYSGSIILEMKISGFILYSMHHSEDKNYVEISILSCDSDQWCKSTCATI